MQHRRASFFPFEEKKAHKEAHLPQLQAGRMRFSANERSSAPPRLLLLLLSWPIALLIQQLLRGNRPLLLLLVDAAVADMASAGACVPPLLLLMVPGSGLRPGALVPGCACAAGIINTLPAPRVLLRVGRWVYRQGCREMLGVGCGAGMGASQAAQLTAPAGPLAAAAGAHPAHLHRL